MKFIRDIIAEKRSVPPKDDLIDDLEEFLDDAAAEATEGAAAKEQDGHPDENQVDVSLGSEIDEAQEESSEIISDETDVAPDFDISELTKSLEASTGIASHSEQKQDKDNAAKARPRLFSNPSEVELAEVKESSEGVPNDEAASAPNETAIDVPRPAAGRASARSGRVKTRILGFSANAVDQQDPITKASLSREENQGSNTQVSPQFPAGWLVIVDGPGRGASFTVSDGFSQIGRGDDQAIRIDFGDNSISRQNHAAIAYDREQKTFFLGHGGKANLVRINDQPVMTTEQLNSDDTIRIGETTLRFIAFCGEHFSWDEETGSDYAAAL